MRLAILFLLTCCACWGQVFSGNGTFSGNGSLTAVSGIVTLATNSIPGYPALTLFYPSSYVTNGGNSVSMTDLGPHGYHLTNNATSAAWPTSMPNTLNGYPVLSFDGVANYLQNTIYTSGLPHEVVIVCSLTNGVDNRVVVGGTLSSPYNSFYKYGSNMRFAVYAGSGSPIISTVNSNRLMVFDFMVMGSASSAFYTNNVLAASGDCGNFAAKGMLVGVNRLFTPATFMPMQIALIATYGEGNPIPGTNTVARTQVYSIITNMFKLSP